jgi:hypothetical protein
MWHGEKEIRIFCREQSQGPQRKMGKNVPCRGQTLGISKHFLLGLGGSLQQDAIFAVD